jgi:hypothetical protein
MKQIMDKHIAAFTQLSLSEGFDGRIVRAVDLQKYLHETMKEEFPQELVEQLYTII